MVNKKQVVAIAAFVVLIAVVAVAGIGSCIARDRFTPGRDAVVETSETPASVEQEGGAVLDNGKPISSKAEAVLEAENVSGSDWLVAKIGEEDFEKWRHAAALAIMEKSSALPAEMKVEVIERADGDTTYFKYDNQYWQVDKSEGEYWAYELRVSVPGVNISEDEYDKRLRAQGWDVQEEEK